MPRQAGYHTIKAMTVKGCGVSPEQLLIEYLKEKADGVSMTPKQLAKEVKFSTNQQSVLRQEGTFPIPHFQIGSRVFYSIFYVAEFILTNKVKAKEEELAKAATVVPEPISIPAPEVKKSRARKKPEKPVADLSHLFNLTKFIDHLHEEANKLTALADTLIKYQKATPLVEKLSSNLSHKPADHPKKSLKDDGGKI